jgi:hypothetical protein
MSLKMAEWPKHVTNEIHIVSLVVRCSYELIKYESIVRKGLSNVKTGTALFFWK